MKFNTLFLNLLLNFALVYTKSKEINAKTFAIGSSPVCEIENLDKNDKLYYASIPSELNKSKINCNNYVVAMNAESTGKYKLVKAVIRDDCEKCGPYDVHLSVKALKDISGSRKSNVFWAIFSKDGDLFGGPFKPTLTDSETKNILSISGEKDMAGVIEKFTEKAKAMVKSNKVHEKEFPWNDETKTTPAVKSSKKVIKSTVVFKTVTVTDVKKVVVVKTRTTKITAPTGTVTHIPSDIPTTNDTEGNSTGSGIITGTIAISAAAGATLLLYRRKSAKKTYIFGEPLDKFDGKELYAKTKDGQQLKLQIPYNDFNDIAHIQIFSPNKRDSIPNIDVYNIHTQRAMVSDNASYDSIVSLPQPQEQPQPHSQLPIPSNDFMMAFSPIEKPELASIPKENIGSYDCTKITTRIIDDPYLSQYNEDDNNQEIYNSVPKEMNRTYSENSCEVPTDILLEYVDGEDYY